MKPLLIAPFVLLLALAASAQTTASIERELSGYLDNMAKYGSYGGSYDDKKLSDNAARFRATLIKSASRRDLLTYSFPALKDKIYIATSPDKRFRIYSWDLEDGGTMHDFDHIVQYLGSSGKVNVWAPEETDGGGGFYTDIFQTDTPRGPIYLAVSTFIGSTSINGQTIEAFTVTGDKLNEKANVIQTAKGLTNSISFGYDFFSVVDRPERPVKLVYWNTAEKSFRFPIVIEDDKSPNGRVTNKFITYKFNGKYFVKVS